MSMPPVRTVHGLGVGNPPKPRIQPTKATIRMAAAGEVFGAAMAAENRRA